MYHKIVLAGRLGRDPEMRYMQDGTAVTNFSMAVDDGYGDNKRTIWFRVSVWGRRAEVANQYMQKGQAVLVEGRMRVDPNTGGPQVFTRRDGTVGASYEVTASDFAFLGSAGDGEYAPSDNSESYDSTPVVEEDDIPF